jgi:ABC-type xylose transport system permease subunit
LIATTRSFFIVIARRRSSSSSIAPTRPVITPAALIHRNIFIASQFRAVVVVVQGVPRAHPLVRHSTDTIATSANVRNFANPRIIVVVVVVVHCRRRRSVNTHHVRDKPSFSSTASVVVVVVVVVVVDDFYHARTMGIFVVFEVMRWLVWGV